ncbi:hypothetical protein E2P69_21540 [Xanthomonas perforans]|uniref:hypothetical protein n=1 Tax=Xanthomonas perforans TaxID=442694 RepID=UPI001191FD2A|nr:hypothetical protein [Xanthomonas perforans]TVS47735.1 hypothetical protein E2P69_21540 [Xanthomonas perforans]
MPRSTPPPPQREGKPAKPAKKRAGAATVATAAKILPSDRAQLKLPGLPRTRKTARTGGSAGIRVKNSQK